ASPPPKATRSRFALRSSTAALRDAVFCLKTSDLGSVVSSMMGMIWLEQYGIETKTIVRSFFLLGKGRRGGATVAMCRRDMAEKEIRFISARRDDVDKLQPSLQLLFRHYIALRTNALDAGFDHVTRQQIAPVAV